MPYTKTIETCEKDIVGDAVRMRCVVAFANDDGMIVSRMTATIDTEAFPTTESVKTELRRLASEHEATLADADTMCEELQGATL